MGDTADSEVRPRELCRSSNYERVPTNPNPIFDPMRTMPLPTYFGIVAVGIFFYMFEGEKQNQRIQTGFAMLVKSFGVARGKYWRVGERKSLWEAPTIRRMCDWESFVPIDSAYVTPAWLYCISIKKLFFSEFFVLHIYMYIFISRREKPL